MRDIGTEAHRRTGKGELDPIRSHGGLAPDPRPAPNATGDDVTAP